MKHKHREERVTCKKGELNVKKNTKIRNKKIKKHTQENDKW